MNSESLIMNFRTFKHSLECPTLFWVVNTYTSFKGQLKNPLVYETLLAPSGAQFPTVVPQKLSHTSTLELSPPQDHGS